MRKSGALLVLLFLLSCSNKAPDKPLHYTKYDFIKKDEYTLTDSIRLPTFQGTLYLYKASKDGCPNIELVKIDSTGEEILIPAKDALSMPPGMNMEYFNYDYNYQDLEKYLNENRNRFKDIERYKNDLKTIFYNNIKLRYYEPDLRFLPPKSRYDSIPVGFIHHLQGQRRIVFDFNQTDKHFHSCEQILLCAPGYIYASLIHPNHSDSSYSNTSFFLIRDIYYSYRSDDSAAVIHLLASGPYTLFFD